MLADNRGQVTSRQNSILPAVEECDRVFSFGSVGRPQLNFTGISGTNLLEIPPSGESFDRKNFADSCKMASLEMIVPTIKEKKEKKKAHEEDQEEGQMKFKVTNRTRHVPHAVDRRNDGTPVKRCKNRLNI